MPLTTVILVILLVGVVLWAINAFVPMEARVKNLLNVVVIIVLVLWLLRAFGVIAALSGVRI